MATLPTEILLTIFDWVSAPDDTRDEYDAQMSLSNCAAVNRHWNAMVTPLLYRHPQCRRERHLQSLIRTIDEAHRGRTRHAHTAMVEQFSFGHFLSRHLSDDTVRAVMERCGAALRWVNLGSSPRLTHRALLDISSLCPGLRSLYLSDHAEPRFADDSLRTLFQHCRQLQEVGLYRCGALTDDTLATLLDNTAVQHLALMDCSLVSQQGIDELDRRGVNLKCVYITSRTLRESPALRAIAERCRKVYICVGDQSATLDAGGYQRSVQVRISKNLGDDEVRIEVLTLENRRASRVGIFG